MKSVAAIACVTDLCGSFSYWTPTVWRVISNEFRLPCRDFTQALLTMVCSWPVMLWYIIVHSFLLVQVSETQSFLWASLWAWWDFTEVRGYLTLLSSILLPPVADIRLWVWSEGSTCSLWFYIPFSFLLVNLLNLLHISFNHDISPRPLEPMFKDTVAWRFRSHQSIYLYDTQTGTSDLGSSRTRHKLNQNEAFSTFVTKSETVCDTKVQCSSSRLQRCAIHSNRPYSQVHGWDSRVLLLTVIWKIILIPFFSSHSLFRREENWKAVKFHKSPRAAQWQNGEKMFS